jgi:hypothetical protein
MTKAAAGGEPPCAWSAWTESADPRCELPPAVPVCALPPRPMPFVEVLVATPAGKPVVHFTRGHARGAPGAPFARPAAQGRSLAAALVAFSAVAPDVRCVTTPAGVMFFASTHSLHVAAASADPAFPQPVLASLARLAVAFLAATLSANLVATLRDRPHFDVAPHLAPSLPHLCSLLSRALAHPLPYAALAPPALPCPTTPGSRSALCDLLRDAVATSPPAVSHALLVTASAPFPRKLITAAAPSSAPLTPLDVLVLTSMLPGEAGRPGVPDEGEATKRPPPPPPRIFLQSTSHAVPYVLAAAPVELRLRSEDFEAFEAAVGGGAWRPEWGPSGGDVVWAVALAKASGGRPSAGAASACVAAIGLALGSSRASRDLIVAMERPWIVGDVPGLRSDAALLDAVKGIVVLSPDRCAATVGACDGELGMALSHALSTSGWAPTASPTPAAAPDVWRVVDRGRGLQVFGYRRRVLVAVALSTPEKVARTMFTDSLMPWEVRYRASLLSEFDRVALPARTMFGHLLAPFPGS